MTRIYIKKIAFRPTHDQPAIKPVLMADWFQQRTQRPRFVTNTVNRDATLHRAQVGGYWTISGGDNDTYIEV